MRQLVGELTLNGIEEGPLTVSVAVHPSLEHRARCARCVLGRKAEEQMLTVEARRHAE